MAASESGPCRGSGYGRIVVGSLLGTSSMTTYLERDRHSRWRTHRADRDDRGRPVPVLPVFEPLFASIPGFAAAPALVFVAAGFLAPLGQLDWDDLASAVPIMLMAILMPLTFSIAAGIAVGFLAFCAIMLISGRGAEINAGTWVITAFGGLWLAAPLFGG